ncbi:MAG TPA: hypothetical protein VJ850_07675 [Candidatus Limnocylindrales bacterium]|nr:hypothetical protein [Candidatus Limnocylindrales bacterium]
MPSHIRVPMSSRARLAAAAATALTIGLIAACGPGPAPTPRLPTPVPEATASSVGTSPTAAIEPTAAATTEAVATQLDVATSGLPEGTYGCWNYQPHVGFGTYWGELDIDGPDSYRHVGVGRGSYSLSGNAITFTAGDLTVYRGEYPVNGDDIDLIGIGDMDGIFVRCSIPEG